MLMDLQIIVTRICLTKMNQQMKEIEKLKREFVDVEISVIKVEDVDVHNLRLRIA